MDKDKRNDICGWSLKRMRTVVFCCFVLYSFATEGQETYASFNLQGHVKRLYTYSHAAKNIIVSNNILVSYEKERVLSHIDYIFEKNGLLLAENRFNRDDMINHSYIYTYENDKLVDVTQAQAGKFQIERTEYHYDKTGRKIQAIVYDSKDSLENTIVYKYDSLNNLISEKTYNVLNWVITDIRYQYDDKGNCIFVDNLKTGRRSNRPYQEVQKFDDNHNLIYKSFTIEDSLKWEYIASYNNNDSLIYEEVIDGEKKTVSYSQLKYNKHNKRILLDQFKRDAQIPEMKTRYTYDKAGKLLTETVYNSKNKEPFITRTYFYDEKGNWIYCIEKDKRVEIDVVHSRKIIYY
jgi:hypothetical protein